MPIKIPTRRFVLAAGLSGLLLPGRAFPQSTERDVEGGIGGTGIVGILVDFGSVFVAGHRVETTSSTQVFDSFGPIDEGQLKRGDSLTIEASTNSRGQLVAQRIQVDYALVGAVQARASDGRSLTVNGVEVRLDRQRNTFSVGTRVAVSGLWQSGRVVASRVISAPNPHDLVLGTVDQRAGRTYVGGVPVQADALRRAQTGSFAAVYGLFLSSDGYLIANRVVRQRFVGAAGPLKQLSVEGWLEPSQNAPGFRLAGLGHSFGRNIRLDHLQDQRLLLRGGYDGLFQVSNSLELPSSVEDRRALLRNLGSR